MEAGSLGTYSICFSNTRVQDRIIVNFHIHVREGVASYATKENVSALDKVVAQLSNGLAEVTDFQSEERSRIKNNLACTYICGPYNSTAFKYVTLPFSP